MLDLSVTARSQESSYTDIQLKSVLVATDLTPSSKKAVRYAAALARRYGSKFYLAYVVSSFGFKMVGPDALVAATDLAWKDAHEVESRRDRDGMLRGIDHEVIVRSGEIWPELESVVRQKHIHLLVVGTHSRHGLGRLVLGSVAEQIFRHSSCPVLTVGPNCPEREEKVVADNPRPILFATDLSEDRWLRCPTQSHSPIAGKPALFCSICCLRSRRQTATAGTRQATWSG